MRNGETASNQMPPTPMRRLRTVEGSTAGRPADVPAIFARGTSFIGRDRDVLALREMVVRDDVRLVTVVGPPGVGKTSLAKVVAGTLANEFADGVAFVDLSPINEASLVQSAIAPAVGLGDVGGRRAGEALAEYMKDAETLLVLDNLEQVIECGAALATLLSRCAGVKILATSRESLRVDIEHQFPVRTLAVPNLDARVRPADIERVPATALFVDRARMVRPEFALNEDSARSVAEICVRLDGLPLAIEMAAAQVKYLTPETILRELDRSTGSLASSVRNLPDRHRTLHACIAWSYVLLAPVQQTHLRTIAVFRGGFTAGAAEAVAGGDAASACRGVLTALVDKGLAEMAPQSDGTPRLAILETIREFALELSNRAIAAELGVGRRTVDTHVRHILRRLGFRSRVQIGVWMASRSPLR